MLRTGKSRGFTLLEVLIAMVILSLSLMAAIRVATMMTGSSIRMKEETYAQWVALNKLAELRLAKGVPVNGKLDGEDEMAGRNWRWKIILKKTPYAGVQEVHVQVWGAGDNKDTAALSDVTSLIGKI